MDCSPLIKAHDHAFAAAVAAKQASDSTVAISEHAQAAGEFANAARNTTSIEALRTLKLLEQHHRRLTEILRLPSEVTPRAPDEDLDEKAPRSARGKLSKESASSSPDPVARASQVPALQQKRRFPSREMSSSIASNLASARGIRSSKHRGQPLHPSISNDQAPGNLNPHPRRDASKTKMQNIIEHQGNRPAWVPPTLPASLPGDDSAKGGSPSKPKAPPAPASSADAGYTRFYQSFGYLMNKISAPLAFAGLPLVQEEARTSERAEPVDTAASALTSRRTPSHLLASPPLEPDLSKIYSKVTMRALSREEHGAGDSFYVVPISGHTVSYANILSYAEKEKRRLEASTSSKSMRLDEEEEDFVGARDTPVPLSPVSKRRLAPNSGDRELRNKIEELSLENKSLKGMLDNVSRRLHAFEASSQHSAMALTESYRIMRPGSPAASLGSKVAADDTMRKRAHEVEEQLTSMTKHAEQLEKDNRKLQKMLEKYREKWDALKAGARARREAQAGESGEEARQA